VFSVRSAPKIHNKHQLLRERVLRLELEEQEVGVRFPSASDNASLRTEEYSLLEDVTKQHSEVPD
jgi:hypothetical protein